MAVVLLVAVGGVADGVVAVPVVDGDAELVGDGLTDVVRLLDTDIVVRIVAPVVPADVGSTVRLEDVRPAGELDWPDERHKGRAVTFDGVGLTLDLASLDGQHWLAVDAAALDPPGAEPASAGGSVTISTPWRATFSASGRNSSVRTGSRRGRRWRGRWRTRSRTP